VVAALRDCSPLIERWDGDPADPRTGNPPTSAAPTHGHLLADLRRQGMPPQAIAAVDLALWDLAGKRRRLPVWKLLRAADGNAIDVNATIAAADRADAAAEAAEARAAGFGTIKVKVGLDGDAERVAAVRAALGPDIAMRLDANGAWSVDEAIASLSALAPVGIELCEEPVHGLASLRAVAAASSVPIALDESAGLPGALDRRHAAAVCLKIARCGGITGVIDAAARARASGYEVYVSSTLDGPLGIAAALHACAAVAPDRACGLATLGLFAGHKDPLPAVAGRIAMPAGPGLGDGLRNWYA
jgi:L-alanine-DL-glutamate epimerase-like enolase superfamily enzyme